MRAVVIAVGAVVAVALFLLLRPADVDDVAAPTTSETVAPTVVEPPEAEPLTTTTAEQPPPVVRVQVRDGRPVGGVRRATVDRGDLVTIVVTADVADHVHVHGYDLMADVTPGERARIRFEATAPGRFEVELEDRGVPIAELTVR